MAKGKKTVDPIEAELRDSFEHFLAGDGTRSGSTSISVLKNELAEIKKEAGLRKEAVMRALLSVVKDVSTHGDDDDDYDDEDDDEEDDDELGHDNDSLHANVIKLAQVVATALGALGPTPQEIASISRSMVRPHIHEKNLKNKVQKLEQHINDAKERHAHAVEELKNHQALHGLGKKS